MFNHIVLYMNFKILRKAFFFPALMFAVIVALVSQSCMRSGNSSGVSGDTLHFKYAEHISIVRHGLYSVVTLSNPWKSGAVLHRYVLVASKDSALVHNLPEGTVVYTPVSRAVVFTSPHCYLLHAIGAAEAVKGVCDLSYINISRVQQEAKRGSIVDCGNSMSPSVERIVSVSPQAIFVSPYEGASYGQIERIGVPIVECADYMETSALGRAEWMRFYGMLVGREHEADSLFAVVEDNYLKLRKVAAKSKLRPRVVTERVVSGVWYCPGGKSSMGRLISDAGGRYVFADDVHSGSLTLSPEKVVERAADADCWLFVYNGPAALGSKQLLDEYPGYRMIKAFRNGDVYECGSTTGIPYFEEISFRPDFLLRDFVSIFHPDLKYGAATRYYNKM